MTQVIKCYCGAGFRGEASYSDGMMVLKEPCPACGDRRRIHTIRGELAVALAEVARDALYKEKKAKQAANERAYADWWDAHRKRMKFTDDWKPSYNVKRNGPTVLSVFPTIGGDDFCWLCNQIAKAVDSVKDNCIDNWRFCYGPSRSDAYMKRADQGCCGFYDDVITNPKTGTTFCVGFNYGH